ncbi:MAG: hypothetical protein RIR62_2459 [Pseudomonadota bacterium]|jgi:hypothetical protein
MDRTPSTFDVIDGGAGAAPQRRDTGHYFDQTIFDLHYRLQSARAHRMALEEDLSKLGISVDPVTGAVTLAAAQPKG